MVTYWNEGATRLFGWSAEEMVGRPYADRFPEPVRSWIVEEIRARAGGSEWSGEYEDYRKDGSRVWIDSRVSRIHDAEGRVIGILGLSHDITERKKVEEALKEADRRKDDFIALLAHELRNLLAPIRNGLQVMRLAGGDAHTVAQARGMMERQRGHMVRLIDDLLDISRISRNKMELRRSRVLLADVVSSAVETARPLIDAGGHTLTVSLPPQPVFLNADLTRLAQVFGNLLSNSAKYTPRGGTSGWPQSGGERTSWSPSATKGSASPQSPCVASSTGRPSRFGEVAGRVDREAQSRPCQADVTAPVASLDLLHPLGRVFPLVKRVCGHAPAEAVL